MTTRFPTRASSRAHRARRSLAAEALEPRVLLAAQLVKDLVPGSVGGYPSNLTAFGDKLVFSTAGTNPGLWVSDGTDAGTVRIGDQWVAGDSYEGRRTVLASRSGQAVYFDTTDGLWKTDGTAAGTTLVSPLESFYGGNAYGLTESGGVVYFALAMARPRAVPIAA